MKYYIKYTLIILFSFMLFSINVSAKNSINSYDYDIYVNDDGSANIKLVINSNLYDGNEFNYSYINYLDSNISDLSIVDDIGNNYDSDKYSISNSDCITNINIHIVKYGNRIYTLSYKINNFVYKTSDNSYYSNINLIAPNLLLKPNKVKIKLSSNIKFSSNDLIWAYGSLFKNDINDGSIIIESDGNLAKKDYVSFLIKYKSEYFNNKSIDKVWNQVIYDALQDSNIYSLNNDTEEVEKDYSLVIGIIVSVIIFVVIIFECKNKYLVSKE